MEYLKKLFEMKLCVTTVSVVYISRYLFHICGQKQPAKEILSKIQNGGKNISHDPEAERVVQKLYY